MSGIVAFLLAIFLFNKPLFKRIFSVLTLISIVGLLALAQCIACNLSAEVVSTPSRDRTKVPTIKCRGVGSKYFQCDAINVPARFNPRWSLTTSTLRYLSNGLAFTFPTYPVWSIIEMRFIDDGEQIFIFRLEVRKHRGKVQFRNPEREILNKVEPRSVDNRKE